MQAACIEALAQLRWPEDFACARGGGESYYAAHGKLESRGRGTTNSTKACWSWRSRNARSTPTRASKAWASSLAGPGSLCFPPRPRTSSRASSAPQRQAVLAPHLRPVAQREDMAQQHPPRRRGKAPAALRSRMELPIPPPKQHPRSRRLYPQKKPCPERQSPSGKSSTVCNRMVLYPPKADRAIFVSTLKQELHERKWESGKRPPPKSRYL